MTIEEMISDLVGVAENTTSDADKFENGKNNAAGTRIRKAMQEIKKIANDVRSSVTDIRNERKGA